jgi:hypothetical protein
MNKFATHGYAQALYDLGYVKQAELLCPGMEKDAFLGAMARGIGRMARKGFGAVKGAIGGMFRAKPVANPVLAKGMDATEDVFAGVKPAKVVDKFKGKGGVNAPLEKEMRGIDESIVRRKQVVPDPSVTSNLPRSTKRVSSIIEPPPAAGKGAPAGAAPPGTAPATAPPGAATPPPGAAATTPPPGAAPPPAAAGAAADAAPAAAGEVAPRLGMLGTMKKHPILTGMAGMGAGYGAGTLMSSGVRDPGMAPQQRYQQGGF